MAVVLTEKAATEVQRVREEQKFEEEIFLRVEHQAKDRFSLSVGDPARRSKGLLR